MNPDEYDAWYDTPRGRWIGESEYRLLLRELDPQPGEQLLDVGCGTGWFTRRLSAMPGVQVTGVDINAEWLDFARSRDRRTEYLQADALALPFADASFDGVFSVAALCFTADWQKAVGEIVRVARRRFAIGLLNRHSLLWREKGRGDGSGAYHGARWLSPGELRAAVAKLPVTRVRMRSAIFLPGGSAAARAVECALPAVLPWGGLIVLSGDKG